MTVNHKFVIGVGSQRAGSTLLSRLLETSSNITMHPVKELHFFDTLHGYRNAQGLKDFSQRQLMREIDRIASSDTHEFINRRFRCYLRANMLLRTKAVKDIEYLDLFRPIVRNSPFLGEITPEYMLLNEADLQKMREVVGDNASIILLCRNPVKRIVSAVKLMNQYNNLKMSDDDAGRWLLDHIEKDSEWIRCQDGFNDYEGAIHRLRQVFSSVVVLSYDQLVEQPATVADTLREQLGVKIDSEGFVAGVGTVVNGLGDDVNLNDDLMDLLKNRYRGQAEFLQQFFSHSVQR